MEDKKWYQKIFTLWNFIILFGTIGFIMLVLYFRKFNGGLSDNFEKWGAFGDYFGSITGLLAFLGVLYSLVLSKKETEEAKKETQNEKNHTKLKEDKATEDATKREERDLFFKLLELDREQFKTVKYLQEIFHLRGEQEFKQYEGIEAFEVYKIYINEIIILYLTNIYFIKMDKEYLSNLTENERYYLDREVKQKLSNIKHKIAEKKQVNISTITNEESQTFVKCKIDDISFYGNYVSIEKDKFKYFSESHLNNINYTDKELYNSIKLVGNILNDRFGHILGQYIRNLYYILETCNRFQFDKNYYFKIYRAQLSRSECILLLCASVSDKSSVKFVKLLYENNILDEVYYKDLLYTNDRQIWKVKNKT